MNANDCDGLGNGGYNAPGMEGLDPPTATCMSPRTGAPATTAGTGAWAPTTCW